MRIYNVVLVFDPPMESLLMCLRKKPPFPGLLNLVGGKLEPGERALDGAYRELREETGIGGGQISLRRLMDFAYPLDGCALQAFAGRLREPAVLREESQRLCWVPLADTDFADPARFAGQGNIAHMLEQVRQHPEVLRGE